MSWSIWPEGASEVDLALYSLVAATLILLLALYLSKEKPNHHLHLIPGPKGLPLVGSLFDVAHPRAHQTIAKWAERWPVYKFKLLQQQCVVLSHPREIEPLLVKGPLELPKAIKLIYSPIDQIYSPTSTPSFFTTKDDTKWAAVRKGCAPAFSPENVRKSFPVIRDTVAAVCDQLAARAGQPEGVDMSDAALRVALDAFGLTAFGRDFQARSYGACEPLEVLPCLLAEFSRRALHPLRAVKHKLMPWLSEARQYSRNLRFAYKLWAQLARDVKETNVGQAVRRGDTSLRVCMAKLKDPVTGELLSEAELASHAAVFLVAGFETTGQSVAWALYELARHPEVQSKLAAELEGAGLLWAPGRPAKLLEHSDLAALPYLDQVWREALRLHSVGSVGPIREADRDIMLRTGHIIPKGTIVWCSVIAVHLSPLNFVEPGRFWPERWQHASGSGAGSGGSGKGAAVAKGSGDKHEQGAEEAAGAPESTRGRPTPAGNSAAPGRSFMPFSYGPRDCMGQAFGNMEGKVMLAMFCARFEFAVAPCMGSPEDVRAAEVNRLSMQPGNGMWLLLTPRGGARGFVSS